jgi:multicomponent Na+:H+ antiporter subunit G
MDGVWSYAVFIVSWAFLAAGAFTCVVGAVGLIRFPDVYTRMHAAGVVDTGGAGLILIGLMVQEGFTLVTAKLVIILFFLLFTGPTATYALASSATSSGLRPWTGHYGSAGGKR